jgi:hypothetical protein
VAVNFICGGNRRTRRKSPTSRKSLTNFMTHCWRLELTASEVIGTGWIDSCKFTTVPSFFFTRNLVGSSYGSPLLRLHISSQSINKYGRHRQFLFLVGWFLNLLLKPLRRIKQNFTGSIYGRFSICFPHFFPIGQKHGRYGQFLFLKFKKSSPLKLEGIMNGYFVWMMGDPVNNFHISYQSYNSKG